MFCKRVSFGVLLFICVIPAWAQTVTGPRGEVFSVRIVKNRLSDPWSVVYGPDRFLWVTEAKGYRVSRINPTTGAAKVLIDLNTAREFPRYDKIPDEQDGGKPWPQGGLMGLALHPQLLTGKPYVYLAYVYRYGGVKQSGNGSLPNYGGHTFSTRLVRYEYDVRAQTLTKPAVLCDTIPGSNDHNSGRLTIAPVAGKPYLFYTVGDMGAGQFDNAGRPNKSQNPQSYEGKVLRFDLDPSPASRSVDRWVPTDNPFGNAVWSYGHRNAQGITYAVVGGSGKLYASEHGPYSDDEINIVERGKNYGHPLVIGYTDDNYNGLAAGVTEHDSLPGVWHTTYPFIQNERENARMIGTDTYRDPIKSLYPLPHEQLQDIFLRTRSNDKEKPEWPAEAPSSLAVYTASAIPDWQNSLLVPSLKNGHLIRLKLSVDGRSVSGDTLIYFKGNLRYRDITVSPDGRKIYMAVDSSLVSSGPSKEDPKENDKSAAFRGSIVEFTYLQGGQSRSGNPQTRVAPAVVPERQRQVKPQK